MVASVAELDDLARSIAEILGDSPDIRWNLKVPGYMSATTQGPLADDTEAFDLSRLRGLDLFIGHSWEARHAVLSVDRAGIRIDIWGETEKWAREAATRAQHQIKELAPWWSWIYTSWGTWLISLLTYAFTVGIVALVVIPRGGHIPTWIHWTIAALAGLGTAAFIVFAVPKVQIGERKRWTRFFWLFVIWLLGAVATTALGVLAVLGTTSGS
jgi:hypothetical protein